MEPTRQTVSCDPVAAARGSFATFGGQTENINNLIKIIILLANAH